MCFASGKSGSPRLHLMTRCPWSSTSLMQEPILKAFSVPRRSIRPAKRPMTPAPGAGDGGARPSGKMQGGHRTPARSGRRPPGAGTATRVLARRWPAICSSYGQGEGRVCRSARRAVRPDRREGLPRVRAGYPGGREPVARALLGGRDHDEPPPYDAGGARGARCAPASRPRSRDESGAPGDHHLPGARRPRTRDRLHAGPAARVSGLRPRDHSQDRRDGGTRRCWAWRVP